MPLYVCTAETGERVGHWDGHEGAASAGPATEGLKGLPKRKRKRQAVRMQTIKAFVAQVSDQCKAARHTKDARSGRNDRSDGSRTSGARSRDESPTGSEPGTRRN